MKIDSAPAYLAEGKPDCQDCSFDKKSIKSGRQEGVKRRGGRPEVSGLKRHRKEAQRFIYATIYPQFK